MLTPEGNASARHTAVDKEARAALVASKAKQITQGLRRPRQAIPKLCPRLAEPADDEPARLRLERRLASFLPGGRIGLAVTDNRFTMVTVKRENGPLYRVRLHHMFLDAPPEIERALARYIALNDHEASRVIGEFIDDNQETIRRSVRRHQQPVTLQAKGKVFDLQEVFDSLNSRYFGERIDARITWGTRSSRRQHRSSIKMGSYAVEDRLIRIHPTLDRRFVPRFFLEWIVYHEMLHQVHDIPLVDGRRQFHTPEFLAAEQAFEHYRRARMWERHNLDRILYF